MTDDINKYGMMGLLKAIKENDEMRLGYDLNKMGLDFASKKRYLYKTFWGPFGDRPMNAVDSNADVPVEYRNVSMIRNKLPELKMANLAEDALFYIFYNFAGDVYQLAAASELIKRKWRFHKIRKVWFSLSTRMPMPNNGILPSGDLGECICCYFDPMKWRNETLTINLREEDFEMEMNLSVINNKQQYSSSSTGTSTGSTSNSIPNQQIMPPKVAPNIYKEVDAPPSLPTTNGPNSFQNEQQSAINPPLPQQPPQFHSTFESTIKIVLNQLKKISQGMAIQKSEIRPLINFLNENPEILGKLDNGNQFFNFLQYEPEIAGFLLAYQLMYDSASYFSNLEILLNMNVNIQTLTAVNKFVRICEFKSLPIPGEFLNKFISLCISTCDRDSTNDLAAHRLVRMVCVFLDSLLGFKHFDPLTMRAEIQNFVTSYLNLREASQLYQKTLQI